MNPAAHSNNPAGQPPPPAAFTVDDALFTLFKHKVIIVVCLCLGVLAAAIAFKITPVVYSSKSTLMVSYVSQNISQPEQATSYQQIQSVNNGQNILSSESEILRSLDTAKIVATNIGPEKILAAKGGGSDPTAAAGLIRSGVSVIAGRQSEIMIVLFEHPDRRVVQPVLDNLIQTYKLMSYDLRRFKIKESVLTKDMEEVDTKLTAVETELNNRLRELGVVDIESSKRVYNLQTERLNTDLITARTELEERKRVLKELAPPALDNLETNQTDTSVPAEKMEEYSLIMTQLQNSSKRERELRTQNITDEHPLLASLLAIRKDLQNSQKKLEKQYPSLASSAAVIGPDAASVGFDISAEVSKIRVLTARVSAITEALGKLKEEAFQLAALEPQLSYLKREKDNLLQKKDFYLDQVKNEKSGAELLDKITNIKIIENPTPPVVNNQRRMKLTGGLFGGFLAFGLIVGFVQDLLLNRTIKRSADIKRRLRLPVFLSIPDTSWKRSGLPQLNGNSRHKKESEASTVGHHISPWEDSHHLHFFNEGLRERLVTYFDINNLSHKPKLVAVAGCDIGAGVTSLAAGLAASLSKTGDGNVLLVDMTNGQGVVKSFYKGKPGAAEPEAKNGAEEPEDESMSKASGAGGGGIPKILPKQFTNLVPVLEAKNYDYIVFDMPSVSATSVTPRLASHMDLVLLVLESEKTSQHSASRAGALLTEARANTVAVLNKCRRYVPERLSPEL